MLWNRFAQDREFLDLYANPHFDPSTGIIEEQEAIEAISKIDGPSHAHIKAKASAFILEHCAIDVNPKCWFGANFAGRIPKYVKGTNRALEQLRRRWMKELVDGQPIQQVLDDMHDTKAGAGAHFADHAHWVPDWDSALYLGFTGLRERARNYRKGMPQLTQAQKDYFDSIEIMLTACIRFVGRLADLAEARIAEDERLRTFTALGLFIFVAIPLPGTGAWTGSLIANFLDLPVKKAFWPIVAGVFTAGIIMLTGTAIANGGIQYLLQRA